MSRLIVKNLPLKLKEERLKNLFAEKGTVTDCKLQYSNGVFRKFAFVGYLTAEQAQAALNHFNESYLDNCRIRVEICKPFGDESKPRAWSKFSRESSAYQRSSASADASTPVVRNASIKPSALPAELSAAEASKLSEFLTLHGKDYQPADTGKGRSKANYCHSGGNQIVINGLPSATKLKSVKEFLLPVKPKNIQLNPAAAKFASAVLTLSRQGDVKKLLKRSGEYFGGYQISITEGNDCGKIKAVPAAKSNQEDVLKSQKLLKESIDQISDSGRLFVRNLPFASTEDDLRALFESFGKLAEVLLPVDSFTKQHKAYALITFVFPDDAVKAFTALDGTVFQGRMLHVLPGKEKTEAIPADAKAEPVKSGFKSQKLQEQKKSANSGHNWNTLFLGANAVADVIAEKYATAKSHMLDPHSKNSLGVRLALGETQLVHETREILLQNGVSIDSFGQPDKPRSKTVILAKNLPAKTTAAELRAHFEKFGALGRIILPTGCITGIVEFLEANEARAAFKALAFRKFKTVPLFLEWAPGNVFSPLAPSHKSSAQQDVDSNEPGCEVKLKVEPEPVEPAAEQSSQGERGDIPAAPGSTVFVKNLNFETTDESLRQKFASIGHILSASVATKRLKNSDKLASMGYGFVQFLSAQDAQTALKDFQGTELDGHRLELRISERDTNRVSSAEALLKLRKKQTEESTDGTKILVRNIPFQASTKEVKELFSTFGQLKTVRLPKKTTGDSHRGFGFVDFVTKSDAKRAFNALCSSTHLYGRRLVIEWADADESLEEVRKRTAEHFHMGESRSRVKKRAKQLLQELDEDKTLASG